jgi:integrase/recombinase XerD
MLSTEECRQLLKAANQLARQDRNMEVYAKAFCLILNTGLRAGELCNLKWDDVNLKTGLLKIQAKQDWTPKTYARQFFLNESALQVLQGLKDREGYVFKTQNGKKLDNDSLRRAVITVAGKAGLKGFTRVHDLRHTFNSLMQMEGVDIATMGKILGHRDIETTMIYTHQTDDHLKKSINKVNIR